MILVDSHTHLYLEEFNPDVQEVIGRSLLSDVKYLVIPNIDSSTVEPMIKLCNNNKGICFPAIGLHPGSVKQNYQSELEVMKSWLNKEKFVAIGEVGIDLYWDKTFISEQTEAFKVQLLLAKEHDLPVIIHSRNSLNEIIKILSEKVFDGINAVFHCFPGSLEQAVFLTSRGYKLGIGGVVTYKNSGLAKIVKELPLQNILLETDSPYLPPVPYRGQRNESAHIRNIAQFIADTKDCNVEEVAEITTANALNFFKINV
jgi:TatD DNase family protein